VGVNSLEGRNTKTFVRVGKEGTDGMGNQECTGSTRSDKEGGSAYPEKRPLNAKEGVEGLVIEFEKEMEIIRGHPRLQTCQSQDRPKSPKRGRLSMKEEMKT